LFALKTQINNSLVKKISAFFAFAKIVLEILINAVIVKISCFEIYPKKKCVALSNNTLFFILFLRKSE